jgi:TonB-linked SusC/RagA family outer membrane protein
MKLIVLLITVTCLQVSAKVIAQTVTLSKSNVALTDVFNSIKQQSGYRFFWKGDDLAQFKVSVTLKNANIAETMDALLKDLPLTYTITEHTVVINQKEKSFLDKIKEKVAAVTAPFNTVSGIVTNKANESLSGATVINKRTKTGTNTDVRGFFTIRDVQPTDTLQISFIGYKTFNVPAGKSGFLNVKLDETDNKLDEVVVQAYGHTTQRTTTGNIGRITAADIEKQPVTNPLLALEGKIPGVVIAPQTGYEDGPVKVEIRGHSTLNPIYTTDPLYIIDGVPLTILDVQPTNPTVKLNDQFISVSRGLDQTGLSYAGGQSPLYNINPQDISSIEVLKDADATAIYGSRGANGVILITTKRGKSGSNQLTLNVTEGTNFVTRTQPMLNTTDYIAMRYEQFRNDGLLPTIANAPDLFAWSQTRYTDWQKFAYGGIGNRTNAQASFSGGNEQTTFRLSGGYTRNTDITTVSGVDQRATLAFNLSNQSANKRFTTLFTANYSFSDVNQISLNGISILPPNAPSPYDSGGNINFYEYNKLTGYLQNPFSRVLQPYNVNGNALTTNLSFNYTIVKGLTAAVSTGYTFNQNYQTKYQPIASLNPYITNPVPTGTADFGNNHATNWIVEPKISYTKLIAKGTLDFLAGGTIQANSTEGLAVHATGYSSDAFIRSVALGPVSTTIDNYGQFRYTGIFARIGYNWDNKYIINFNGRRDGSSRFGDGKQFGNFGSVGIAWIASEESWLKKVLPKEVNFIKLRSSYGLTGSDNISDYQYLALWGNTTPKLTTYNGVTPLTPQNQSNPDFQWSVNKKLDVEGTVELFNGAISLDADYYRDRSDNQLVTLQLPEITGFTGVTGNSPANVQNSGWEFTLSTNVHINKSFTWQNSFNIAFNKNVLLGYPDLASSPYRNQYKIGESINTTYVYNYTGVDPYTGLYTYTDYNHDGKITSTTASFPGTITNDNGVKIDREPAFSGGMTSTFSYKSFQLTLGFNFVKQMALNVAAGGTAGTGNLTGAANMYQFVYDGRWQYAGQTDALYMRLSTGAVLVNSVGSSNAGYTDASYIRLRTATINYTLPVKFVSHIGIRSLAVNISTNNMFLITAYKGYDPEVTTNAGQQPPTRTIVSGLTASF